MKLICTFFFVFLVSPSLGNPSDYAVLVRERREVDFIGNTQLLVQRLIENLENAAKEALDATRRFREGLQQQAKEFAEKIVNDIKGFRGRVDNAIKGYTDRFTNAGDAVRTCVETFRKEVDAVFSETVEKSNSCTDESIKDIGNMIENLKLLSSNATSFASNAVNELRNCRETNAGFFATGTCLGGVAVRSEVQGAMFLAQSGLLISRINLAMATLPATLEVCAGSRLVAAGMSSAKFVVEIGTCSTSSVYSSFTRNDLSQ